LIPVLTVEIRVCAGAAVVDAFLAVMELILVAADHGRAMGVKPASGEFSWRFLALPFLFSHSLCLALHQPWT
jgi:hypothetical protein